MPAMYSKIPSYNHRKNFLLSRTHLVTIIAKIRECSGINIIARTFDFWYIEERGEARTYKFALLPDPYQWNNLKNQKLIIMMLESKLDVTIRFPRNYEIEITDKYLYGIEPKTNAPTN